MARKKRMLVKEVMPDHVRASDYREPSLLATSPTILKQMEERRGAPLIVPDTVKIFGMHKLSVAEVENLLVDIRYQREEVTLEVNELIHVLKKGGVIPDPISVAERKYGDRRRYIVDGQQRWWAHIDCGLPLHAVIYHVGSYDDEVALFHALNMQTRVAPETRLRSWLGPAGDAIRKVNDNPDSPFYQKIDFEAGNHGKRVGAMILLRGMAALISNTKMNGGLDRVGPTFDRYYKMDQKACERMISLYIKLLSDLFDGSTRLRSVTAVALAKTVHGAFMQGQDMPTPKQLARLKAIKWESLTPTHSMKWIPTVVATVQEVWPVTLVQEARDK